MKQIDPRKERNEWALAAAAKRAPRPAEARQMLGLTVKEFSRLMDISEMTYYRWAAGEKEPTLAEKILIARIIDEADARGLIVKARR